MTGALYTARCEVPRLIQQDKAVVFIVPVGGLSYVQTETGTRWIGTHRTAQQ